MSRKIEKLQEARKRAHAALEQFFDAIGEALSLTEGIPARPVTTPPTNGNGSYDLEESIRNALQASGRRPPVKIERAVNGYDTQTVLAVRGRTPDKDWPETSRRLQSNLKLRPQQVAGIIAASRRTH